MNGASEVHVDVSNKKLDVQCVWSLDKLRERLVKMRKLMYAVCSLHDK